MIGQKLKGFALTTKMIADCFCKKGFVETKIIDSNIPKDAEFRYAYFNAEIQKLILVFYHKSFDPLEREYYIPVSYGDFEISIEDGSGLIELTITGLDDA